MSAYTHVAIEPARGWSVVLSDDNGKRATVATYTAKYKAREHGQRIADRLGLDFSEPTE